MAAAEENFPLHGEHASVDEGLLDVRRRPAPKVGQVLSVAAALALAGTALVAHWQNHHSVAQLPSRDTAQRVFLSETAVVKKDVLKEEDPAVAAQAALAAAGQLVAHAADFKENSDHLTDSAAGLDVQNVALQKKIAATQEAARKARQDAEQARTDAEASRQKADALLKQTAQTAKEVQAEAERKATEILEEARKKVDDMSAEAQQKSGDLGTQAEGLDSKASGLDKDATQKDGSATSDTAASEALVAKAQEQKNQAAKAKQDAIEAEKQARHDIADHRICISLPGVKLRGNSPAPFDPVVGNHTATDDWQCNDWCLKHSECKQSVFTWETKTCELFKEATAEALQFRDRWPFFNSSYCDTMDQKKNMLDMLHQVYETKPWVPEPHNCSWGADNCLHTGCCADVCDASWDFATCKYYTCFKRDETFGGCRTGGPPANWDGKKLGGHPNTEVAPAPEGKLIQGTRLYCFSVIMWNQAPAQGWQSSEAELANNWKKQNKGIMLCDDYSMFDGYEGGSVHNIQSFLHAWDLVKEDGRWKQNDWTIKVDPDAVFFPDHFRSKVEWQYRTPQGAAVYMRNTFYKFQFLGALEVLTREATELYMDRRWECEAKLGQQGGEDYWLLQCLEGLGIDFQTDMSLLHDKYAADENCFDPNSVAHHFFKKVVDWDSCWNGANDAWNNAHPA